MCYMFPRSAVDWWGDHDFYSCLLDVLLVIIRKSLSRQQTKLVNFITSKHVEFGVVVSCFFSPLLFTISSARSVFTHTSNATRSRAYCWAFPQPALETWEISNCGKGK